MSLEQDIFASISAGREWLERHSAHLLPDTLVFARIGLRAAGRTFPAKLRPPHAGRVARTLIPLSPEFNAVAAGLGRLHEEYRLKGPFAGEKILLADRDAAALRCAEMLRAIDRGAVNRALADAVRGRLSMSSLRWMCRRDNTGFILTHQLLAWLVCVWSGCRVDAADRARHLGRRVFSEAACEGAYGDLLAQQTAFLALGGWPAAGLRPLISRVLEGQDADDGGWHYFERRLSGAGETLSRVCHGQSALLGWPIPYREDQFGVLANVMHDAHRAHATGVSLCAMGIFWRAFCVGCIPTQTRRKRSGAPGS